MLAFSLLQYFKFLNYFCTFPSQVSNYKQNYGSDREKPIDDVTQLVMNVLNQSSVEAGDILDQDQSFIQEVLLRHGKQLNIVCFLTQTVNDVGRFCCNDSTSSTLAVDTTFNIGEHYVTESAFRYLALRKRNDDGHPWFPGPIMAHRNKETADFAYLWQACKRANPVLKKLRSFGTDEDDALINGILQETEEDTVNLLGEEHVRLNIQKKLLELSFPARQIRMILEDIFGKKEGDQRDSLINSESFEDFDQKVELLKDKWVQIEKDFTRNDPAGKFVRYFEKHKQAAIREKMTKLIRKSVNEVNYRVSLFITIRYL